MSEFESHDDWYNFSSYLINENRFVLNSRWQKFINALLISAKKRETVLKLNTKLYRARIGANEYDQKNEQGGICYVKEPYQDFYAPPKDKTLGGRLNPRGIPYLYLASDIETAIAEVRPWKGAEVSLGHFHVWEERKLIDITDKIDMFQIAIALASAQSFPEEKIEEYVWSAINLSFAKPVSPFDNEFEYIPTQYLAQLFHAHGFDGIKYNSAMHEGGYNICLFVPTNLKLYGTEIYFIRSIKYDAKVTTDLIRVNENRRKFSEQRISLVKKPQSSGNTHRDPD